MSYKTVVVKQKIFYIVITLVLTTLFACGNDAKKKRVLVLGFDGMDYHLMTKLLKKKHLLPNLARLAKMGSFKKLRSTTPPQSPVAWSTFITGMNPGKHGIFDFISRDPKTYIPTFSMSRITGAQKNWNFFGWIIPTSKPQIELLRDGAPFWKVLEKNKIPATIVSIPVNFPPAKGSSRSLSGMGTPDILGSYGIFSFYTDEEVEEESVHGGKKIQVMPFANKVEAEIEGPQNSLKEGNPKVNIPFSVFIDEKNPSVKITVQDNEIILSEKEWSKWVQLNFHMAPMNNVKGMVRFYLKEAHPHFKLYMSPVNIDPTSPPFPISTPDNYAAELAKKTGNFYTQGIAEDTGALNSGVLNEDEFLEQCGYHENSRKKIFEYELARFKSGVLFCYFSSSDLLGHMFWRFLDPKHPNFDAELAKKYRPVILNAYKRLDTIVGEALDTLDKDDTLIVMSDHGFGPFRRFVNLNTWLHKNGYLNVINESNKDENYDLGDIDWERTRFYSLGLNSLYTNLQGREAEGIVLPSEKEEMEKELIGKLEQIVDPSTGENIFKKVYRRSEVYSGKYLKDAPDMLLGYNWGYRNSWETALGEIPKNFIGINKKKWGGDHCIEPSLVPGVIFSNRHIKMKNPGLEDLAPTIIREAGAKPLPEMEGKNIF